MIKAQTETYTITVKQFIDISQVLDSFTGEFYTLKKWQRKISGLIQTKDTRKEPQKDHQISSFEPVLPDQELVWMWELIHQKVWYRCCTQISEVQSMLSQGALFLWIMHGERGILSV